MSKDVNKEIIKVIRAMSIDECDPEANSDFHLGYCTAQVIYAKQRLELIKKLSQ